VKFCAFWILLFVTSFISRATFIESSIQIVDKNIINDDSFEKNSLNVYLFSNDLPVDGTLKLDNNFHHLFIKNQDGKRLTDTFGVYKVQNFVTHRIIIFSNYFNDLSFEINVYPRFILFQNFRL
jgi:hypothetical protein